MLDQSVLEGLLAKVREAKGPDRELDKLVLCALIAPAGSKVEQSPINGKWCIYDPRPYGRRPFELWSIPNPWRQDHGSVTGSVDAALVLVERLLPGAGYEIIRFDNPVLGVQAEVGNASAEGLATAPTAPLAILTALLLALSQDETREGVETVNGTG